MFDRIKQRISGTTTASDLDRTLTKGLGLPSVYSAETLNRESGRRLNGDKRLDAYALDFDDMTTVDDLKAAVEEAWKDDGVSVRLVSPTDRDGIDGRTHLKTLRDAG